jgi:hypothetical protein
VDWTKARDLPTLEWTKGPLPPRTAEDLGRVLDTTADRRAALLGAAQALLDGGRVVFERPGPDDQIIADLWMLLPTASRAEMWPATFALKYNRLSFNALAVADVADTVEITGYLREKEAMDYPEGRYESALRVAVDSADEEEVARLLARPGRGQMMRLAIVLLIAMIVLAVVSNMSAFRPAPKEQPEQPAAKEPKKE